MIRFIKKVLVVALSLVGGLAGLAAVWPTIGMSFEAEAKGKITFVIIMALSFLAAKNIKKSINK